MSVLALLAERGTASIAELAAAEGVAHPTMSRMVKSMLKAGLVDKRADEGDRRSWRIEATTLGSEVEREAFARRQHLIDALIVLLRPETVEDLAAALGRLAEAGERAR